ncbi:hypothetical protein M9H77_06509 [Catharanthus roseus]|uniref:Uncharacterized protein n=1 Tax=Catharanthus roseus TaxID=4058 RepID=A0ACC0BSB2_CATRO|nr:hypothetical protein M9H77_06509 [Catharanthus roseus]
MDDRFSSTPKISAKMDETGENCSANFLHNKKKSHNQPKKLDDQHQNQTTEGGSPSTYASGPIIPDVLAWILREFTASETDDDLIMRSRGFIFLLFGGHMLPDISGNSIHGTFMGLTTGMKSPCATSDLGLVAYSCITSSIRSTCRTRPLCSTWWISSESTLTIQHVVITRTFAYQPTGVNRQMMIIKYMVSDEHSMLYLDIEENDEDDDDADEENDVSSKSDDDNNSNDEEDDISTSVNPLSSTTVNQWVETRYKVLEEMNYRNLDSPQNVADVKCPNMLEKIAITPIQAMYKFLFFKVL